jgi:hypothetical protein
MQRRFTQILGATLAVGLTAAAAAAPAATGSAHTESFRGVLVASGDSGTRTVFSTFVVATGVFNGAGRIVEIPNRPDDPDSVSRDDLVFPQGKLHLVSTSKSFATSLNSRTCALRITIRQTARIEGGTGKFRHATGTFAGGVRGRGIASRDADGTCSQQAALLLEVDRVFGHGTLSF